VLRPAGIIVLAAIFVAGCAAPPRPVQPGDWNSGETAPPAPLKLWMPSEPANAMTNPPAATNLSLVKTPAVQTNCHAATWIPLRRWSAETGAGAVHFLTMTPTPAFTLTTTNGVFVFHADNRAAKWRGVELHLGFAPQFAGGQLFVHELDLKKNVEPLLRNFTLPEKTNRVIVIDPGHGGKNAGTESILDRSNEKEFTLDWARRLAPLLATNGWQVFLTRTNDSFIELSNRVAFAEERKANLFISLHFNSAAPGEDPAGLETYCLTPTGMPSNLLRTPEDDASLNFANNRFDTENIQIAARLHRALLEVNGHRDRGLRHARFIGVLRGQNRPAVLIEGGYLSNPHEARRIADPAYRQKLAEAVAEALTVNTRMEN
jgi:N-acetylmuramoyl-L-alanine amidase